MVQMKTLTVNGKTYEVADPDAAHIDDTAVGENAWSGRNTVDRLCPAFTESGSVISCEPVEGYPLGVVTQIEPVQAGEGDPSPENIRPITGHTSIALTRCGKNLFDDVAWFESHGFTPQADGSWFGTAVHETIFTNAAKIPGSLYVTAIVETTASRRDPVPAYTVVYYTDGTDEVCFRVCDVSGFTTLNFRTNPNKTVDRIQWTYGGKGVYYTKGVQISFVDDEYEPYKASDTFTLDLGQTVYGGSLDWASGVLTVTHGYIPTYANEEVPEGWVSNTGELSHGAQVVYPLQTPVTVQLTPREIPALSGINTLYSDTGDTAVTGKADPVAKLERLENAILALGGSI